MKSRILLAIWILAVLTGCSLQSMATGYLQDTLSKAELSFQQSENFYVLERAFPAFIVLLDSSIAQNPENSSLLLQGAKLHIVYGISFAEPVNLAWAKLHYEQAKRYMDQVWRSKYQITTSTIPYQELKTKTSQLAEEAIADIFWLAMSWGNYINTHRDDTAAIAAIPFIELLMDRVLALDENYEHAMPHLFLGVFYSASPSQPEREKARSHFEKALELTKREMYLVPVTFARTYATAAKDKKLFESLLEEVVSKWENRAQHPFDPQLTLSNAMAYQQAQTLLGKSDDFFPTFDTTEATR